MSAPKPTPQPNRLQRRALQRATEPATMTTTATSTHSAHHTCDQLGVCNSRTPACKANQCQQGRAACPVPQACEVAERTQPAAPRTSAVGLDWGHPWAPLEETPASAKDIVAALAVVACAVAAVVVIVVSLAP